jgi:uncharacterized protein YcbK (DUF882 family)
MTDRRRFLAQAARLGAAGFAAGVAGACTTPGAAPRAPITSAAALPPAPSTPIAEAVAPPAPGEPVPPPDLFDANLLGPDFWSRPREINWIRPQTGETLRVVYWKDGQLNDGAYERMCHILRDVEARKSHAMDPQLIDTLWACQAFCARYGIHHPVHILSGFRTPATNDRLVEQGLPAARKSLHLDGRAADVRIVDLNSDILGSLVQSFARGGVGFYSRPGVTGGWIHTDTGVNRVWRG